MLLGADLQALLGDGIESLPTTHKAPLKLFTWLGAEGEDQTLVFSTGSHV